MSKPDFVLPPVDDILRAETMIASSWPALRLCLSGRWLLGMADGVTGRANSLFFLDPHDDRDVQVRLDWMEATYRRSGLRPCARLSPLAPEKAVTAFQDRNYTFQNPTLVLRAMRPDIVAAAPADNVEIEDRLTDVWLDAFTSATPRFHGKRSVVEGILGGIMDPVRYCHVIKDGEPAALAMAVNHLGVFTIQNVVTVERFRREGHARRAMDALLADAWLSGAEWGFVAVDKDNGPAISLYESLGFTLFYRYIYAALDE